MRLVIVRHGKAQADSTTGYDFDRDLKGRGERQAAYLADRLASLEPRIARVLASRAVRAHRTAEALASGLGVELSHDDRLLVDEPVSGVLEPENSASNLCLHAAWGDGAGIYYGVGGRFSVPYAGVATYREIGDPDVDPGPAPIPIRTCETVDDCGNDQVCEDNRCVHEDACEADADCSDGEGCRNTLCAPALCGGDGDCPEDLVCIQGQCAMEGTGTCATEPDCELGETCSDGLCMATDDPDIQYWVRTGAAEPGPVPEGGTIPFFSGFQGGMHTFVTIRATGFPADAFTSVVISITDIESGTMIVSERTYPATFTEVAPGVNELEDLFVIFSRTPAGGPDGAEVEVNITVTDGDDSSITASLVQTAAFGPAQ